MLCNFWAFSLNLTWSVKNLNWFNHPGMASVLIPSLGTVLGCCASAAVIIIWWEEFMGNVVWLSVSSNCSISLLVLPCGLMYVWNYMLFKCKYWYLQYHWCPFHFSVGLWILSVRYNSRRDGTTMKIKIIAGAAVHVASIICSSNMTQLIWLLYRLLL